MQLDNLDLLVKDVEKAVDFYHGTLGLPFFLPHESGEDWAAVQCGSVTLYIFETTSEVTPPSRRFKTQEDPPGFNLIGLEVQNLDETIAELDGSVEWTGPARSWEHPSGVWYRFRACFDPERNLVSFTEPHKDSGG